MALNQLLHFVEVAHVFAHEESVMAAAHLLVVDQRAAHLGFRLSAVVDVTQLVLRAHEHRGWHANSLKIDHRWRGLAVVSLVCRGRTPIKQLEAWNLEQLAVVRK